MPWWNALINQINENDILYTPGRGLDGGNRRKNFLINHITKNKITIISGGSLVPLDRECFDIIENVFLQNPFLWLRTASLHEEPISGSADELIRVGTGSDLARGNYICAILQHCGLVRYSMRGNQKGIELPQQI
jgi:hypothetical protein